MISTSSAQANLRMYLALLLSCVGGSLTTHAAPAITLSWDANTETDLAGYRVYSGATSGSHTLLKDVGNVTSMTVTNPPESSEVYYVVTAYNTSGLESPKSAEVSYSPPVISALVVSCPPSMTVAATSSSGAIVNYPAPTVTDLPIPARP